MNYIKQSFFLLIAIVSFSPLMLMAGSGAVEGRADLDTAKMAIEKAQSKLDDSKNVSKQIDAITAQLKNSSCMYEIDCTCSDKSTCK